MTFLFIFIKKKLISKKFQSIVLLCAICISATLLIIANALTEMIKDAYLSDLKYKYIESDIYIKSADDEIISDDIWKNNSDIDKAVGTLEYATVSYPNNGNESAYINVEGILKTDLPEFEKYNIITEFENDFSGNIVYITKQMSEKYNLVCGNKLSIRFGQNVYDFKIVGIYDVVGMTNMIDSTFISFGTIVPRETLKSILNTDYNTLYLRCKKNVDSELLVKELKDKYPKLLVKEVSDDIINQELKGIFTTFNFLAVLVIITCLYIMITSYRVILKKRIHEMGIIRSLGGTRHYVRKLMISEAIILGGIGGILGSIVGYY